MAFISQEKNDTYYISSWKHTKSIPNELINCSTQEFELILALSSEALKSLREKTCSIQFQEILNKKLLELNSQKQKEFENLQNEFIQQKNYEQTILQRKIQELQTNLDNSNQLQESLKSQKQKEFNLLKTDIERQNSSKEIILQNQIKELQTNLEQSIKSYQALNQNFMNLQTSTQKTFETYLYSSLESQKQTIEEQHNKIDFLYKKQIDSLQTSLNEYTKKAITNNVSSNKGKSGEQSFDSLVESFTTWKIEDTSKTPQSCDRFGEIRGCKTLFEIKNYSYNIPRKEIDKFKRDLECHIECPLGIFISLNTSIVGAPQDFFYTEFTSSNQLLIYIQQFNNYDSATLFSVLNSLIDISLLLYSKSTMLQEDSGLQYKVDGLKSIVQEELLCISKLITESQTNSRLLVEIVQKQNSSLKHNLEKIQFTFKKVFQTLFDDSIMIETSHDEMKPPRKRKQVKNKETTNTIS
jgi:hypothetical protein